MRWALPLALGAILALLSPAVSAQQKQDWSQAKTHFKNGERYYNVREYEKALEEYKTAYLMSEQPALLFNMGQCYRFLERYEEAISTYKTFLRVAPDTPLRKDIEGLIIETEALLAKRLAASAPAAPEGAASGPSAPADPVAAVTPEPTEGPKTIAPPGMDRLPAPVRFAYASATAAGIFGLTAGGLAIQQAVASRRLDEAPERDVERILDSYDRAKTFGLLSDGLIGAAVITGAVGYLLSRRPPAEPDAKGGAATAQLRPVLSLTPAPGGAGATLSVRF
jgi:tetratricopeptide (TPR) repeat protein